MTIPTLHIVTTDEILQQPGLPDRARDIFASGQNRVALHLRGGHTPTRLLYELAIAVLPDARRHGAWLIVNDRLDVTLAAGVDGVQLTTRSIGVRDARRLAPSVRVGASVHSVIEARAAFDAGADWVVAGNVYRTATHPDRDARGIEFASEVARRGGGPTVAIGGIQPQHVPALRANGLAGFAVIRGIWGAHDAGAAVADYLSMYDRESGRGDAAAADQR